ncbi:MAG TPA: LacI family DNA-binding transcriptional regulator [Miltoncostaea sp.]|nr:LacI family DNA-binding transcriptional regulator [Miltoncostaea sp.]
MLRQPKAGPTLRDVAAAAGVSVWTVSNAYSNAAKVSEAARQRVFDAAAAIGYLGPHPGARSLARGRTGVVAFVAPGDSEALLGDPAAALVARGLLTACHRAGHSMLLSGQAAGEMVDGRVFFREVAVTDRPVPTIVVDGEGGPGITAVRADVRGAARAVAGHLHDLGHRHIAVLAWREADERLAGVSEGWDPDSPPPQVFALDVDRNRLAPPQEGRVGPAPAAGEALARAALARHPRPTALLALSDTLAMSALHVANWMRLDVPGDLSVAGIDDLPGSDAAGLTSALVPYRPLGERAGDLLMALLEGEEPDPFPDIPTSLAIRRSTGPPP